MTTINQIWPSSRRFQEAKEQWLTKGNQNFKQIFAFHPGISITKHG